MILCSNPAAQYGAHRAEIDEAMQRVLQSGRFVLGSEVAAFEDEFARYIGVAHGIGVGSGTEALHLALAACGIGPGDEVITASHTAVATVSAIRLCGATPVVVDIDAYFCLDIDRVREAITARTKAIIPVHLYGQAADMTPLMSLAHQHGLRVIEDVAQAHGARYEGRRLGSFGDLACFSFYPTKNLGAIGDGGMVVTDDPLLAERVRTLREYGWQERYISRGPGWNSRLDELQAAVLRVKLRHLDADNEKRQALAALYARELADTEVRLPRVRPGSTHVYHLFVIRSPRRDGLQAFLRDRGVGALVHYPAPVHLQPAYRDAAVGQPLSLTEQAATEILSLPMYPELTTEAILTVAEAVQEFVTLNPVPAETAIDREVRS